MRLLGKFRLLVLAVLSFTLPMSHFRAEEPPIKKLILPGESFRVEDRPAFVMLPSEDKRTSPQPWILYAPTLPAYPDKHEKWMHEQFLEAGIAVAGIDMGEAYGSPESQKLQSALYEELTKNRGFAVKPCLLGRSRGGLWASSWAIANPKKVAGIAGIYPVFDLRAYPGLNRASKAYGMAPAELESQLPMHNPIAKAEALAKHKIPVCLIHGDQDTVVPLKSNSQALAKIYEDAGESELMKLVVIEGQGHNFWEGFFRSKDVIEFAIRQAKAGANASSTSKKTPAKKSAKASGQIDRDIEFAKPEGHSLKLDLYRPQKGEGPWPVVMWVHGGGWRQGSKNRCPATWLVDEGFAVVSISYRLTDKAQWPAQIDDCRAAVRWLRTHAKKYNLDGDNIAAWGGSAGGHLVALLGTLDAPNDEPVSSRVQAVCDWYGPTDLLTMPPNTLGNGRTLEDIAKSNGAKLLGQTVRDIPEVAKSASGIYHVSKDDPPFLVMHGDKDPGVPLSQSTRFVEKFQEVGGKAQLHIVQGAGHGGKAFQTPEVRKIILEFFETNLRSKN